MLMDQKGEIKDRSRTLRVNDWIAVREPLIRLVYRILIILGLVTVAWELYGTDEGDQDDNQNVESVDVMVRSDLPLPHPNSHLGADFLSRRMDVRIQEPNSV